MYILKPIQRYITVKALNICLDVVREKGFVFKGEMHNFWEAVFIESGQAVAAADEQIFNLKSGQLLFHQPMEFHRIRSADQSAPHLLIISFAATGPGMELLKRKCFDLLSEDIHRYHRVFSFFSAAQKEYEENGATKHFQFLSSLTAGSLEEFLLLLCEKGMAPQRKPSRDEIRFKEIVELMNNKCECNLSVDDIANMCHTSASNVKRLFALYCDRGVAKYFLSVKIRRAMQLLDEGISCIEVSDRLGFSSVNYFHTVFKRETGLTPGMFCKRDASHIINLL